MVSLSKYVMCIVAGDESNLVSMISGKTAMFVITSDAINFSDRFGH